MKWTTQDIEYLKANYESKAVVVIANKIKHSKSSVIGKARDLGIRLSTEEAHRRRVESGQNAMKKAKENKRPIYSASTYLAFVYFANVHRKTKKTVEKTYRNRYTMRELLEDVCVAMEQDVNDVLGEGKQNKLVICRFLFCFIVKKLLPNSSHKNIADFIGYREHTMSMYAIQKVNDGLSSKDPLFMDQWYTYLQNTKIYKL